MTSRIALAVFAAAAGCSSYSSLGARSAATAALGEPQPQSRPGLGTVWGETRVSRIHEVPFERAGAEPFAQATLFYNDRAGVVAMASRDLPELEPSSAPIPVRGGLVASVFDESERPLETVSWGGRLYVVGAPGVRYSLRVHNQTARRYEVVASVDGLDVVDGESASFEKRGYVIEPFGTLTIDGFRQSRDLVAAFRFGAVGESYAARTGDGRNVGVIGLAFFDEQGAAPPPSDDDVDRRRTATPFSDARFAQPPSRSYY
ncbi:MAG TPA: hypothetical protein VFF06_02190 [Polyangia bacterium]|nr:hypothetical protein [Polyangia bacterium]